MLKRVRDDAVGQLRRLKRVRDGAVAQLPEADADCQLKRAVAQQQADADRRGPSHRVQRPDVPEPKPSRAAAPIISSVDEEDEDEGEDEDETLFRERPRQDMPVPPDSDADNPSLQRFREKLRQDMEDQDADADPPPPKPAVLVPKHPRWQPLAAHLRKDAYASACARAPVPVRAAPTPKPAPSASASSQCQLATPVPVSARRPSPASGCNSTPLGTQGDDHGTSRGQATAQPPPQATAGNHRPAPRPPRLPEDWPKNDDGTLSANLQSEVKQHKR